MKTYGRKLRVCQCRYCGETKKESTRKGSERQKSNKELHKYKLIAKPSKPSFSKKFIDKMMKK